MPINARTRSIFVAALLALSPLAILSGTAHADPAQTGPVPADPARAAPAAADGKSPDVRPPDPAGSVVAIARDQQARMTVPVMVNGQGPFPFVIDTGADRTVISRSLADQLKLTLGPRAQVRGTAGETEVDTARLDTLTIGGRTFHGINAPLLDANDLGAMGMLGVDTLADQHIVLDFRKQQMSTQPSQRDEFEAGAIVVHGRYRFGQLILVDARIRDIFVYVILDTGAEGSIGNPVLRRLLAASDPTGKNLLSTEIISVTGQTTPAEVQNIRELTIGPLLVRNLPLAFSKLHTFDIFGLGDKPALLLGMDILRKFQRVSVDFKRREVTFNTY